MSEASSSEQTITIDDNEVKVSDLNPQARGLLAFLNRIDEELRDARYQMDRAQMARQQALQQLTKALNSKDDEPPQKKNKKETKAN